MRCVGVDIAKAGLSAVALAVDGEPRQARAWKPSNPRDSEPTQLLEWEQWLRARFWAYKPDIIVVEQLAVFLNKKTIRVLSHFEGIALKEAKRYGAIVVNPMIGSSRNIVLGIAANSNKETAMEVGAGYFRGFDFGRDAGRGDKMDAMVHAMAGPTHLERK